MRRGPFVAVGAVSSALLAACGLGLIGAEPSAVVDGGPEAASTSSSSSSGGDAAPADSAPPTCAADLATDPKNCGQCAHDCQGGGCAAGTCQPTVFLSGEPSIYGVAVVGAALYWTRESAGLVRTAPLAGGAASTILDSTSGGPTSPAGIASDGANLFVTDRSAGKISKWGLTGAPVWTKSSIDSPTGIATTATAIFFTIQNQDTISSADLDGNNISPRMLGLNYPAGVAVSGGRIYASSGSGILVAPEDGGTPVTTVSPTSRFKDGGGDLIHSALAVEGATVWFTINDIGVVAAVPTTGGIATVLATQQPAPIGIAVTPSAVYWANNGAGTIMKLAR